MARRQGRIVRSIDRAFRVDGGPRERWDRACLNVDRVCGRLMTVARYQVGLHVELEERRQAKQLLILLKPEL